MKFKYPYDYSGENREYSIAEFAETMLDGASYEGGALEAAQEQAEKVTKAFGRLLTVLADKKQLTREELYKVITGYEEKK